MGARSTPRRASGVACQLRHFRYTPATDPCGVSRYDRFGEEVVGTRLERFKACVPGEPLERRSTPRGWRRRRSSRGPQSGSSPCDGLSLAAKAAPAHGYTQSLVSLVVDQFELGPIGTNCYVVRADGSADEAVVVDPGGNAVELRLELARQGARCAAILITHAHWDHLGGVADLAEGTGAPVYMAEAERIGLERIRDFAPPEVPLRPYSPDVLLSGDETLELAGITFETLLVPGHSPAHLAYYADGSLFSGDVLFAGSVGRTDLPGADWETLVASIRLLVDRFPAETVVYSGHGPPTTIGAELARNPFLAELRAS
jgi:hydroxyacylglutathione hydrolase